MIGYLKRKDLFNSPLEATDNFSVKRGKSMKEMGFGTGRIGLNSLRSRLSPETGIKKIGRDRASSNISPQRYRRESVRIRVSAGNKL